MDKNTIIPFWSPPPTDHTPIKERYGASLKFDLREPVKTSPQSPVRIRHLARVRWKLRGWNNWRQLEVDLIIVHQALLEHEPMEFDTEKNPMKAAEFLVKLAEPPVSMPRVALTTGKGVAPNLWTVGKIVSLSLLQELLLGGFPGKIAFTRAVMPLRCNSETGETPETGGNRP